MISANALRGRKSDITPNDWILDSGAFTEISAHGRFRTTVEEHAEAIHRWSRCGNLLAAVAQDFMCEPFVLQKTGLSVPEHQALTIERYRDLKSLVDPQTPLMPVLQGRTPEDYARHARDYGTLLGPGAWVGVGSVCKRQGDPAATAAVLRAIAAERPDLRLHGFGVKLTALADGRVRALLHSADSMAWSYAARKQGRDANDPREAHAFVRRVEHMPVQLSLEHPAPRADTPSGPHKAHNRERHLSCP